MKQQLKTIINDSLTLLKEQGALQIEVFPDVQIEQARDKQHGDYACNIAMLLAKPAKTNPRNLAEMICANIPKNKLIRNAEVAGPGFINFFLSDSAFNGVVEKVIHEGENFGRTDIGAGKKIHIETISANPTGPLHVGHGRLAAYGQTVSDLLAAIGYDVHREYYLNDAGRQMRILATSIWMRYLELCGKSLPFPSNGYRGKYIIDIAKQLYNEVAADYQQAADDILQDLPADADQGGDKDAYIDALGLRCENLIGAPAFEHIRKLGLDSIAEDIREDCAEFGVVFQKWYPESYLVAEGKIEHAIDKLKATDHVFEQDGALWFRSTDFADDKDRVLIRENGQPTYFAADVAYHVDKYEQGFDFAIDIFGADHHGYQARMFAVLKALGISPDWLKILLVQFAILYRDGEKISMSTRGGSFVTLRELRDEVGNDAARYFYIMRKPEQHLDFDLDLAKSASQENPVYYVQYAHARVCSVLRQCEHKGYQWNQSLGQSSLALLQAEHERELLRHLTSYPETVIAAASQYEPHTLTNYLQTLAHYFHTYYNAHQFLVDDDALRNARLSLIIATRQVLSNGLQLLGLSAPDMM